MLASVFELIFLYITLEKKEGKPPSIYRLCKETGLNNATLLSRRKLAYELGIICEIPKKRERNPHWMVLTEAGANAFVRVLDRQAKLVWCKRVAICKDRKLFPKNIIYLALSEGQYDAYVQALKRGAQL